jgi:hypothetical protein
VFEFCPFAFTKMGKCLLFMAFFHFEAVEAGKDVEVDRPD